MQGYIFTIETEAIAAQKACDNYYGIPVHPDDVTQHWCGYNLAELNDPQFWDIIYHESLLPVLGEPSEFEIIHPEFN